jgi:Double-stranded RNA binding motif
MSNVKEFTQNGITICFYQKPGDEKYSFLVKGNHQLTDMLLKSVSTKRVPFKGIHFVEKALFEKIESEQLPEINTESNPIVELSELVQKRYGESIKTRVTGTAGSSHSPIVYVEIELPSGEVFKAAASNQRLAKQKAAQTAILTLHGIL